MEKFKLDIQRRIYGFAGLILLFVLTYYFMNRMYGMGDGSDAGDFIRGFQLGIFAAMVSATVVRILIYNAALRDDDKLRKLHIEETDERNQLIALKAGGFASLVELIVSVLATLVAGFFSNTVFFTLLGVVLFIVFLRLITKLVYQRIL
ncbi:MAG TPA: hypothetical protein DEO50_02605 [Erysipelotrichaceae bacterium]|nr:MAG: hypothetical protein A2Y19_06905 [Firmicutes bacterium GWE2_51_13]HBZ40775.1 hypothetical protein [Erysipelotrichaceae bacterium]